MNKLKKEMRDTRLRERKQADEIKKQGDEMKKMLTSLVDKDDYIAKLNKKISELGTKDLLQLNQKMVKKANQAVQTEEEQWEDEQNTDKGILNKYVREV